MKKKLQTKKFVAIARPTNLVYVSGRVTNKAGMPINGVVITCGKYATASHLDGSYSLLVPANDNYVISATKQGYEFFNSVRTIHLEEDDKVSTNFKVK